MADEILFTLRQIADELKLPESTVRYYRDGFLDLIPTVGTGRRRRYPSAAVAVLRSIAGGYATGLSRPEVIAAVHASGPAPHTALFSVDQPVRSVPLEEVTNLDLLAAILDGEREQRDALWQMAKEIVRLTDVLEGQDSVLNEIADRAGVIVSNTQRISRNEPSIPAIAPAPAPAAAPPQVAHEAPIAAAFFSSPPAASPPPFSSAPAAIAAETSRASRGVAAAPDIDRLRAELETERALVERLRESKLDLEHRAADAEAALEDRSRQRRPSVLRRLLGIDTEQ